MLLEHLLLIVLSFATTSGMIYLLILCRDVFSVVAKDKKLQALEAEEAAFEALYRELPQQVIPFEVQQHTNPCREFVEEFLMLETIRTYKGMFDYATTRTRLIRKARRLVGETKTKQ